MAKKKVNKIKNNYLEKHQKIVLSVILIINMLVMLLNWFGKKGGIEISGTIILFNPITVLFILMILWGTWYDFKININRLLMFVGMLGLIAMEIYYFLTWHLLGYFKYFSIDASVDLAFPEFYLGIGISIVLLITGIIFQKKY